jgi:hypothetical protein
MGKKNNVLEKIKMKFNITNLSFRKLELSEKLICVIEPLSYFVGLGLLFLQARGWYFFGVACVLACGYLIAKKSNEPNAQAISQLYILDIFVHLLAIIVWHLIGPGQPDLDQLAKTIYDSILASLTCVKILAIFSAAYMRGEPGWPSLIPFIKSRREINATVRQDIKTGFLVFAAVGYGIWATHHGIELSFFVWFTPVLIALSTKKDTVIRMNNVLKDNEAVQVAVLFQSLSPTVQQLLQRAMLAVEAAKKKA